MCCCVLLRLLRLQVAAFATGGGHGSFPVSILFMSETLGMSPSGVGKKTALFAPFIYKNQHFTKTGSGRT
jgi:hypothetical protein